MSLVLIRNILLLPFLLVFCSADLCDKWAKQALAPRCRNAAYKKYCPSEFSRACSSGSTSTRSEGGEEDDSALCSKWKKQGRDQYCKHSILSKYCPKMAADDCGARPVSVKATKGPPTLKKTLRPFLKKSTVDQEAFASLHNSKRRDHGASSLSVSNELARRAQEYADELAETFSSQMIGTFLPEHSDDRDLGDGRYIGENIAWSNYPSGHMKLSVNGWYDELFDPGYDCCSHGFANNEGAGHFTQVVWKDSREIGCGQASNDADVVFVVCQYFPAGNVLGQYPENVQCLKSSRC